MMKVKLGVSITVLAFSALGVASALAAPGWERGGKETEEAFATTSHGTFTLVHEGGSLGKAKIRCTILLIGTVGPGAADKTTLVENLTGTEKDLVGGCENLEGFCAGAVIHPVELPWDTKLFEEGGKIFDDFLNAGYNVLCSFGVQFECKGTVWFEFVGNDPGGALLKPLGRLGGRMTASDGGECWIEGPAFLTLGAFIS